MKLALFDLDHTLLPIDSDYSWASSPPALAGPTRWFLPSATTNFFADYQAGTLDVHEYVRFATQAVRQHTPAEAEAAHARFMTEVICPALRTPALDLVRAHQAAGDQVLIITATNEFVTRPIAHAFGVTDLIAIELERDAHGQITGEICGVPSFREGKVTRLRHWLAERGWAWEACDMTFYSDSTNDLPLLEQAQQPVATNPSPALRALAQQRGWRILDLFSEPA